MFSKITIKSRKKLQSPRKRKNKDAQKTQYNPSHWKWGRTAGKRGKYQSCPETPTLSPLPAAISAATGSAGNGKLTYSILHGVTKTCNYVSIHVLKGWICPYPARSPLHAVIAKGLHNIISLATDRKVTSV